MKIKSIPIAVLLIITMAVIEATRNKLHILKIESVHISIFALLKYSFDNYIYIIIMIILAGAIILSLSKDNVITKAKLGKESTDFTGIKEMVDLAKSNELYPGATAFSSSDVTIPSTYSNEISVLNSGQIIIKGVATGTSKISDIGNAIEKLDAVYIPTGFEASTVVGEMTKAEGLVVKDVTGTIGVGTNGNEYVWVPVEGTLSRTAFRGESLTTYIEATGPAYDTMAKQVEKYNGFYVSRYEAGTNAISTGSNLLMTGAVKPLSQKNKIVWNNIPWAVSGNSDTNAGAALVAKNAYVDMATGTANSYVASSLLYGAQYDAMLNYINSAATSVTNSTTWGNHYNSTFTVSAGAKNGGTSGSTYTDISTPITKPANTNWLLTTGASEQNKAKNIYDVAGNVWEWTYETNSGDSVHVIRSGSSAFSGAFYPAAFRDAGGLLPHSSWYGMGFRFALYIK